jgi:acyl-CoA thioesterase FadM
MGGFITKWAVRQDHPVTGDDLDGDGTVRDGVLEGWVAAACSAYLERCPVLQGKRERDGLELRQHAHTLPAGSGLGRPDSVVVTARATEFRASSFVVAVRLRPLGGERDVAVDVWCEVQLEDPATGESRELESAVRDELISIEHAARHYN